MPLFESVTTLPPTMACFASATTTGSDEVSGAGPPPQPESARNAAAGAILANELVRMPDPPSTRFFRKLLASAGISQRAKRDFRA
jgi:hypothetical protein